MDPLLSTSMQQALLKGASERGVADECYNVEYVD